MDPASSARSLSPRHGTSPPLSLIVPDTSQREGRRTASSPGDFKPINEVLARPDANESDLTLVAPEPKSRHNSHQAATGGSTNSNSLNDVRLDTTTRAELLTKLKNASQSISEQQARFAKLRERAILCRGELSYERENLLEQQRIVSRNMSKVIADFQQLPATASPSEQLTHEMHKTSYVESLSKDQEDLREQAKKVDTIEYSVSQLEYDMRAEEGKLAEMALQAIDIIRKLGMDLPIEARVAARLDVAHDLAERDQEDSTIDPLLLDYYDKVGEIKIIAGRKVDFETDYNVAKTEFIHNEDHEIPNDCTLDEFEDRWERDRMPYIQFMERAHAVAEEAREACIKAGLDPDGYKKDLPDLSAQVSEQTEQVRHAEEQQTWPTEDIDGPKHKARPESHTSLQKIVDAHPNNIHMAYRRSEVLDEQQSFVGPVSMESHQPYPIVEHIGPEMGPDTPVHESMEQSQERIQNWIQDISDSREPSNFTQANEHERSTRVQRPKAVSLKSWPQTSIERFANVFPKLLKDTHDDDGTFSAASSVRRIPPPVHDSPPPLPERARPIQDSPHPERPAQLRRRSSESELHGNKGLRQTSPHVSKSEAIQNIKSPHHNTTGSLAPLTALTAVAA